MGRLADLFGRKYTFILGCVCMGVFGLASGFAQSESAQVHHIQVTLMHTPPLDLRRDHYRHPPGSPGPRARCVDPSWGEFIHLATSPSPRLVPIVQSAMSHHIVPGETYDV